eukprot:7043533-Pyramimonas_sp.AAC.1
MLLIKLFLVAAVAFSLAISTPADGGVAIGRAMFSSSSPNVSRVGLRGSTRGGRGAAMALAGGRSAAVE